MTTELPPEDAALLDLLRRLAGDGYQFTTPAPSTHRRVMLRRGRVEATSLADVFGWSLPFRRETVDVELLALMAAARILKVQGELFSSTLRVASVRELLFLHSAFPPDARDTVFFGPDSYRFTDFIRAEAPPLRPGALVADVGAGAGVGGIFAINLQPQARLLMTDVNRDALRLARVNAAFAGQSPELQVCDGLPDLDRPIDLVLANPPYIGAGPGKTYSDGGKELGAELSLAWTKMALSHLAPGGRLLLYSGSAIVRGRDALKESLAHAAAEAGCAFSYRELDADVFPATLLHRRYWAVERIAAVGAVVVRPG